MHKKINKNVKQKVLFKYGINIIINAVVLGQF